MTRLLGFVAALALTACAPPGRPIGFIPRSTVEIENASRAEIVQVLVLRGFTLSDAGDPTVIQGVGPIHDGDAEVRVAFILKGTGATGRAWWRYGRSAAVKAVTGTLGISVSEEFEEAAEDSKGFGKEAFAELAAIAASVRK